MAMRPLEAGITGKSPVVGTAIPRAHYALLRETAAARGLTMSKMLRQVIASGLDAIQGDDLKFRKTQEARGHHTPGSQNADSQRHQLGHDDRTLECTTISTTITATSDG